MKGAVEDPQRKYHTRVTRILDQYNRTLVETICYDFDGK